MNAAILTKRLSKILRHNAGKRQIQFDNQGYAPLVVVLETLRMETDVVDTLTAEQLIEALEAGDKQRFEIVESEGEAHIRAFSGHSFDVDIDGKPYIPDGSLWFGTSQDAKDDLCEFGFFGKTKLKVRLMRNRSDALEIAKTRGGGPLLVEIDAERMVADGWEFGLLDNGEVVTDHFGPEYCAFHIVEPSPSIR